MQTDELKSLAKTARNRLKNGFWTRQKAYREKEIENANSQNRIANLLPSNYNHFNKSMVEKKVSKSEQRFLDKVREIVSLNLENPIGELIDYNVYNNLGYDEKQRYILNLAEKYREVVASLKAE